MSESTQALCFLTGANSIFTGEKLLTTPNAGGGADAALFAKLGLKPLETGEPMRQFPGEGRYPGRREAAVPAALDPGLGRGTESAC